MGMRYADFMDTPVVDLWAALDGWRTQQKEEAELRRTLFVEQTVHLMNASGNMKRLVKPSDFGIKTGPSKKQDPEEIKRKAQLARQIEWRV